MSKYSKDELKRRAQIAIEDRKAGGIDYMFLKMTICVRTGITEREFDRRVDQLAVSGEWK